MFCFENSLVSERNIGHQCLSLMFLFLVYYTQVVMEWYFSKPNWRVMSGSQHNQHQVPVRLDWYSQRAHIVMNMFNFDAEAAETTAFDIKPCLKWDEQRFIQFGLSGEDEIYVVFGEGVGA